MAVNEVIAFAPQSIGSHASAGRPATSATTAPPDAVLPERAADAPPPGTPLASHYDHCFGCGPRHPQGLRLSAVAGEGLAVNAEFTVQPGHQGGPGLVHGGILVTAMDETLGTLNWHLSEAAVTGRLETDLVLPVLVGSVLHIRAEITGVHRRKVFCEAEARIGDEDGPIAVRAKAVFIQVRLEHFTKHGRPEDIDAALTGDGLSLAR
ncbi:PaaI family thioesterase [Streptomyces sp. ISL-100]|uniref:PaaI family thioesterase n=1 Tax=Streptomyces sp. ISL-100 TaxID=2819173 RepID=UPI001BE7F313|nr:PaaI family thioesterase [Streptomyces sp. ISL-100]MBT2401341.1 PaaI family thioesterase [Streptomyces sp. ISL-100]